jgi:hypothetical protein
MMSSKPGGTGSLMRRSEDIDVLRWRLVGYDGMGMACGKGRRLFCIHNFFFWSAPPIS